MRRPIAGTAVLAAAVLFAACGGDDDGGDGSDGPVAGESVELEVVDGEVTFTEPGEDSAPLEEVTVVPVGTEVDATDGTVGLTSETSEGGTQNGEFSRGAFEVSQEKGSSEVKIALRGGDFSQCETPEAEADQSTVGGPKVREVFVEAEGEFRTEGRFATAAVRGTTFVAVDACFGTLTDVEEGEVEVSDLTSGEEFPIAAGERYWAAERADAGEPPADAAEPPADAAETPSY